MFTLPVVYNIITEEVNILICEVFNVIQLGEDVKDNMKTVFKSVKEGTQISKYL